jgi:hypothetical protein
MTEWTAKTHGQKRALQSNAQRQFHKGAAMADFLEMLRQPNIDSTFFIGKETSLIKKLRARRRFKDLT